MAAFCRIIMFFLGIEHFMSHTFVVDLIQLTIQNASIQMSFEHIWKNRHYQVARKHNEIWCKYITFQM